jgi:hypothetical protein
MLLAALAFASWWTSHTILDTARTRRVTDAVIGSTEVRHYLADAIAPAVTQAVGAANVNAAARATPGAAAPAPSPADELSQRLGAVLDHPDIRVKLEQFVVDAHELLIGQSTRPAVLDQATVVTLVHAALPSMSLADLARIPPVRISVPRFGALSTGRRAFQNRTWLYALGAVVLLAIALATTKDRHGTIKLIGKWLLGISAVHLLVLWILPVLVAPQLSNSPWVSLVASVARALNAGIVSGLVILVVAGVLCLLVDVFVPATGETGASLPSSANLES